MDAVCTVQVGETCTITWGGGPVWQIIDAVAAIDVFGPVMVGIIVGGGAWALGYLCGYIDGRQLLETTWRPWRRKVRR